MMLKLKKYLTAEVICLQKVKESDWILVEKQGWKNKKIYLMSSMWVVDVRFGRFYLLYIYFYNAYETGAIVRAWIWPLIFETI